MNLTTKPAGEGTELDLTAYNDFVAGLEMVGVDLAKVHAERTAPGAATQHRFDLAAGYTLDDAVIYYRYDVTAQFTDDQGSILGNAASSIVITARASTVPDASLIEQFGGTSGMMIAHPYLREAISSMAQRVSFPGALLPMIKFQPGNPSAD